MSSDLCHADSEEALKRWFISKNQYRGWYLLKNESGWDDKKKAHCGCPDTGGGADYFAFGPVAQTEFFEVKTDKYPTLSKNQKIFVRNMTAVGFKCWIFRQHENGFYLIPADQYTPACIDNSYEIKTIKNEIPAIIN